MDKLNKGVRRPYTCKRLQSGGVQRNNPFIYNGHTIYYNSHPNDDGDPETIFINAGRGKGKNPCFNLAIKDGVATLQSLDRGDDCFADGFDNSRDLVLAAFSLAKRMGCTAFQLSDNSTKSCHSYKFTLSDMYFVTTGRTWYESILQVKIQKYTESKMDSFRKIVRTAKWADVSYYLISQGESFDFDFGGLDANMEGSSMEALNMIAKMRNHTSCKFFYECLPKILTAYKLETFHDTLWRVNINLTPTKGTRKSRASKGSQSTRKSSSK